MAEKLICPNTAEEKIMKLQQSKTQLANDLISADSSFQKIIQRRFDENTLGICFILFQLEPFTKGQ